MRTNYGFIPDNEIKIIKIPDHPNIKIGDYIPKLFDEKIDEPNSHIQLIYGSKIINLKEGLGNIKWPSYFRAKRSLHRVSLPKFLCPKLAYFMGYFYADGSLKDVYKSKLKTGKFEHKIKVGDEFLVQVELLRRLFKSLFDLDVKIRTERIEKGENYYYIEVTDKVVYRFITKIFDLPYGPKTGKLKMPPIIFNASPELKKWFIRGVFDADGETRAFEYYKNKSLIKPRIRLHMKDYLFVKQIKELTFQSFGLNFNGPYIDKNNKATCIEITKIIEIQKAYQQIIFLHPVKKWRLEKLVGKVAQKTVEKT